VASRSISSSAEGRAAGNLESLREPPFGGEKGQTKGLEELGFLWILSSESRLFNGLQAIFGEIFYAPLPGRRPDVTGSHRAVRFAGHAVFPTRAQIFSPQSGRGRSIVRKPSILRPSRVVGKKMSVILGDCDDGATIQPVDAVPQSSLRQCRQTGAEVLPEESLGRRAAKFVQC
jgi:hypothetical protein